MKRSFWIILVAGLLAQTASLQGDSHIPTDPNERMLAPDFTLFLAHYDGDTPHLGIDADYALGSSEVFSNGGLIVNDAKFGPGSLDTSGVTTAVGNQVLYATEGNFPLKSDDLDPNGAGTIEMWFKPNPGTWETVDDWDYFFSIYWIDPNIPGWQVGDIRIYKRGDSDAITRIFAHQDGYGIGDQWFTNTWFTQCQFFEPCVAEGEWNHIAWTWDAVAQTSFVYINGEKDPASGVNNPPVFLGKLWDTFDLGSQQGGFDNFEGLIDEFRISNIDRYAGLASFVPHKTPWPVPECGALQHPTPASDYTQDCLVNLPDFEEVASRWMIDMGMPELQLLIEEWLLDTRP